ncbi:MAG: hypothetical protein AAB488_00950 [Patescibacteria group bacterium]
MNIFERVKKFNLPLGKYAVFGSALLDVWGIRKAADLDIIALPGLYQKLKIEGWQEKKANGFHMLIKDDANVTTVQEKPTDGNYFPDRTRLVKQAIVINDVPFVKIEEVIACKRNYNRQKDIEDIKNIEKYLGGHKKSEWYVI